MNWTRSGKEITGEMEKNWRGKAEGIDPVHDGRECWHRSLSLRGRA